MFSRAFDKSHLTWFFAFPHICVKRQTNATTAGTTQWSRGRQTQIAFHRCESHCRHSRAAPDWFQSIGQDATVSILQHLTDYDRAGVAHTSILLQVAAAIFAVPPGPICVRGQTQPLLLRLNFSRASDKLQHLTVERAKRIAGNSL